MTDQPLGEPILHGLTASQILEQAPLAVLARVPALMRRDGDTLIGLGSACFLRNDGLLVTAWHTVAEVDHDPERFINQSSRLIVLVPNPALGPRERQGLPVVGISYTTQPSDLVLLQVDMSECPPAILDKLGAQTIETGPPVVGDPVLALGYPRLGAGEILPVGEKEQAQAELEMRVSSGKVIDIHPAGRDSSAAPFPCMHTGSFLPKGMSGGPVFTSQGRLIGIVSRGYDIDDADEPLALIALIHQLADFSFPNDERTVAKELREQRLPSLGPAFSIRPAASGRREVVWGWRHVVAEPRPLRGRT